MPAADSRQPPLVQDLAQALSRAERGVVRHLARELEAEACTVEQWRVLVLLSDGRGHPMSEIADFALVPAPSLTRLIDRMVSDGLVHRTIDAEDRRRVLVHRTARARAMYRRLATRIERDGDDLLGSVEAREAQDLLALLTTLVSRLD